MVPESGCQKGTLELIPRKTYDLREHWNTLVENNIAYYEYESKYDYKTYCIDGY